MPLTHTLLDVPVLLAPRCGTLGRTSRGAPVHHLTRVHPIRLCSQGVPAHCGTCWDSLRLSHVMPRHSLVPSATPSGLPGVCWCGTLRLSSHGSWYPAVALQKAFPARWVQSWPSQWEVALLWVSQHHPLLRKVAHRYTSFCLTLRKKKRRASSLLRLSHCSALASPLGTSGPLSRAAADNKMVYNLRSAPVFS